MISGGLQPVGDEYIGKGFFAGIDNHRKTITFALQTDTEQYNGKFVLSNVLTNHITLSWNKSAKTFSLYIDGIIKISIDAISKEPEHTPGDTFSNFITIGSKYDFTFASAKIYYSDVSIWKHPLDDNQVFEKISKGNLFFRY